MLKHSANWNWFLIDKCENSSLQFCLNATDRELNEIQDLLWLFSFMRILFNMVLSTMAPSPLGVNFFWDKGHLPELEGGKWLATVKLAIMVKDNIQVDKLLQPRPENNELDYSTEPHYEPALSDEKTAERRQIEQQNLKRRTDWQDTFKEIENKGPQVDNIPWDEADNKAKSYICLNLGSQATNIFHQRFPHTDIQKCTTDALVEQLKKQSYKQGMKNSSASSFSDAGR